MQNVLADEADYRLLARRTSATSPACPTTFARAAREAAQERGVDTRWDRHAVAFADRAVPHVLGPARPARAGVQGVDAPRRARRRRTTTGRSPARSWRCATSRRACTATATTRTTRSSTGWPARRPPSRACSAQVWEPAKARARRSAMRCRRLALGAGRDARDRALGLALLRREGAQGALPPGRRRS